MKNLAKCASFTALSALLITDITSSLRPQTYAESNGYACWGITVNNPTLANICNITPATTAPLLCTTEGSVVNLPVYFHTSGSLLQNLPYPFRNQTTVLQDTVALPTPVTNFTLGTSFANSPMPVSYNFSSVANTPNATITLPNQSSINYTPNVGFLGNDVSTYTTTDANGVTKTGKFVFKKHNGTVIDDFTRVIAANVRKDSTTTNLLSGRINSNVVGYNSSYTPIITTPPTNGTLTTSTFDSNGNRIFNYTPNAGFTGEDSFLYTLTNSSGTSTPTRGLIQVYDPATRPIAPYMGFHLFGSPSTYGLSLNKTQLGYDELFRNGPETTTLNFTAPQVNSGSLQLPFEISTVFDNVVFAPANYKKKTIIQVDNTTNTAPVISSITTTNPTPDTVTISVTATDAENNQGSFVAQVSNDNFTTFDNYPITQSAINGTYSTTINTLAASAYSVRVMVQENNPMICAGFSNAQVATNLHTTSSNRSFDITEVIAPTATTDTYSTTTPEPVTLVPLTGDTGTDISIVSINGTTITPSIAQTILVPNGTVTTTTTGEVLFTPDADFTGEVTFPYEIKNVTNVIATGNQIITVNPKAVDDTYTVTSDSTLILNPLFSDTSGTTIKSINGTDVTPGIAQTISVTNGTITISDTGIITFTPNPNFSGTVSFPYIIQNSTGQSATGNQSIVVTASTIVNQPPTNNPLPSVDSIVTNGNGKLLTNLIRTGGSN
jgi:large repetitive protein